MSTFLSFRPAVCFEFKRGRVACHVGRTRRLRLQHQLHVVVVQVSAGIQLHHIIHTLVCSFLPADKILWMSNLMMIICPKAWLIAGTNALNCQFSNWVQLNDNLNNLVHPLFRVETCIKKMWGHSLQLNFAGSSPSWHRSHLPSWTTQH